MSVNITIQETIQEVDIIVNQNIIAVTVTRTSGGGGVQSVTGTTVDNTDPLNPVVNVPTLQEITDNESGLSVTDGTIQATALVAMNGVQGSEVGAIDGNDSVILRPQGLSVDFQRGANQGQLNANGLDGNYSWALPNASGTIAMVSDITPSAVDSVNGQTGVVVLDAGDVGAEPTKGSDDNYVTDAQLVVIGNTSGTNSGDNATNTTSNAYADAKVADTIADGVTTVAPSQNAVFDALALKQNNLVLGKKGNASSPVTGTTTETILESIFIPAGSVAVDDIIYIRNRVFKTGGTGGFTVRYRINSSNSISGSSVLGFATLGTGSTRSQGLERTLNLRASNTIEVVDNTTSIAYENASISNANVNITFTFTSDFWILITGQLGSGGDSMVNSNYIIQKF